MQQPSTQAELRGRVALVTGGAKRVGRAIALTLARHGMDVAITFNTSPDDAKRTGDDIRALGVRAEVIRADFLDPQTPAQVAGQLLDAMGRCDALINNASCFDPGPIGQVTHAQWLHNMTVNAWAPLALIQALAPELARHADPGRPETLGRIVNFIDIHVMGQPLKHFVAYNASKAALQEITQTCALELAPKITVNAIAPGVVAWADSYTPEQRDLYMRRVPLGRPGTPEDAAAAVLFLVKDAHYCTGQTIRLDGGRLYT